MSKNTDKKNADSEVAKAAKAILDDNKGLEIDGRKLRFVKPRMEAIRQGSINRQDAEFVIGVLEQGNEQAKTMAASLRRKTPAADPPAAPTAPIEPAGKIGGDGSVAFKDISINRFNRSYGQKLNPARIDKLATSIGSNGLIQRVVLVRVTGKDWKYEIVVGAHRVEALRKLHGKGGVLNPNEYVILEGVGPDDMKCLEVSIAENRDRKGLSPYEIAVYIVRLTADEGMSQKKVGDLLGMDREVVNPLVELPKHYSTLPKAWQKDLAWTDGDAVDGNVNLTPAITLTHWRAVAPAIRKAGVTPDIRKMLTAAAEESWPVSRLVQEIRLTKKASTTQSKGEAEPATGSAAQPASAGGSVPQGPDYAGILVTLGNARELAHGDEKVGAVIATAISEIEKLQATASSGIKAPTQAA